MLLLILLATLNTGRGRFINGVYSKPTYLLSTFSGIGIGKELGECLISTEAIRELCLYI